jgi:hypothetical protein
MRRRRTGAVLVGVAGFVGCGDLIGASWDVQQAPEIRVGPTDAGVDATYHQEAGRHDAGQHDAPTGDGPSPFMVVPTSGGPSAQNLNAITGWDSGDFVAVGTAQVSYVSIGGSLTRLGGDVTGSDLYGVWGTSSTDVYAVGVTSGGNAGFIQHLDANGWTTVFNSPTALYGVWGVPGDSAVVAVGDQGVMYGRLPDGSWMALQSLPPNPSAPNNPPQSPMLTSITGLNLNDFTVTSDGDQFFEFPPNSNGYYYYYPSLSPLTSFSASWQAPGAAVSNVTNVYLGSNFLGLYWITSPDLLPPDASTDASILGADAGSLLLQLYGDNSPGAQALAIEGIWGTAAKVVAVGDNGTIVVFDVATGNVTTVPGPDHSTQSFGGVWGASLASVWIVGTNELILNGSLE